MKTFEKSRTVIELFETFPNTLILHFLAPCSPAPTPQGYWCANYYYQNPISKAIIFFGFAVQLFRSADGDDCWVNKITT